MKLLKLCPVKLLPVSDAVFVLLITLVIAIGCIRIGLTYHVFWQTWDEPFHLAAGMEWLEEGQYTYEPFHPPLARVMAALGPYLVGVRGIDALTSPWYEGSAMLHSGDTYERTLTLARLGILPFFVVGAGVVTAWANGLGGKAAALLALVMFTTLPPVLAHSGFATLDMACAALVAAALFAFSLWLKQPTLGRSLALGVTVALALLSKLSALGFLIVATGLVGLVWGLDRYRHRAGTPRRLYGVKRSRLRQWAVALAVAITGFAFTIWAGYQFSVAPLASLGNPPFTALEQIVGSGGAMHRAAYWAIDHLYLPAPEFAAGLYGIVKRDQQGHLAYFLGDIRRQGWWYFFPLMLAVKTPLPLLLLSGAGMGFVAREAWRGGADWRQPGVPAIAALGILVVGMLSSVNNGVRQILGIYPLLAVVAGYGAHRLMTLRHPRRRAAAAGVALLVIWQLVTSFASHPDYVAYFNELAGGRPEEIAVVGDLDWGQDLKRLAQTLEQRGIEDVAILYHGSHGIDLGKFGLSASKPLEPYQPTTGWVAISIYYLKLGTQAEPYDQFAWLNAHQPVERVGKTILLYYIPDGYSPGGSTSRPV